MFSNRIAAGLILAAVGATQALAQSNTSILRYDDKGRVIGQDRKAIYTEKKEVAPQPQRGAHPVISDQQPKPGDSDDEAFEPGEVIVVDPPADFLRTMGGEGYALIERIRLETLNLTVMRLRIPTGTSVGDALAAIGAKFPSVVSGANHYFRPGAGQQGNYGHQVFGWGDVSESCGKGLRIGMVDTIVDLDHPALKGRDIARSSFLPKKTRAGVSDHGTAVAAILVGADGGGHWNGLLPGASLYAANIFSETQDGGIKASLGSMMQALDWLASKNVQVVNISLAGSENNVLSLLMERAAAKGLAIVAAAGNGGAQAKPAYPAAHPKVLAVTAVDQQLAPYNHANQGDYIDFAAPGVALWTAQNGGGALQSGTSFAAPFITGAVALQIAAGVPPDPDTLRSRLRQATKDLGTPGRDAVFGWGLVRIKPNC
jgi:hypothetical protein